MYIPLSIPATPLPPYLQLDRKSQWHTSALLSMALESITLPSRLRPGQGKRGLLDDMAVPLNVNGNQRIATLQCSILEAAESDNNNVVEDLPSADSDHRVPGSNTSDDLHGDNGVHPPNARFDVDLSCGEASTPAYGSTHGRAREHVFGRVDCWRGQNESLPETDGENVGVSRKRRRLAGVPTTERFVPNKIHCSDKENRYRA